MQARKRSDIMGIPRSRFRRAWDTFMQCWYIVYILISFFSILFGMGYVLYNSYFHLDWTKLFLGIVVTLFFVYLNSRSPK